MASSSVLGVRRRPLPGCVLLLLALSSVSSPAGHAACPRESRQPVRATHTFLGHACREPGCAAHKAGFAWADRLGLVDSAACADAEDAAFLEGCRAFTEVAVTAEQSGFEWARANALPDDCLCDGAGPRFAAGCEAFVRAFGQ